jgi:hypothetical protein
MQKTSQTTSSLANILKKHEADLLEEWIKTQVNVTSPRAEYLSATMQRVFERHPACRPARQLEPAISCLG